MSDAYLIQAVGDLLGRHKYRPIRAALGRFHASCICGWMWDADHGTEIAYTDHLALALDDAGLLTSERIGPCESASSSTANATRNSESGRSDSGPDGDGRSSSSPSEHHPALTSASGEPARARFAASTSASDAATSAPAPRFTSTEDESAPWLSSQNWPDQETVLDAHFATPQRLAERWPLVSSRLENDIADIRGGA